MKKKIFMCFAMVLLSIAVFAQSLSVASYNMLRLGDGTKDYQTLAKVISHFDVCGAIEVMNKDGMDKTLAVLPPNWKYTISDSAVGEKTYREFYGFFYDDSVELVKTLGFYPDTGKKFARPPYGVQFRVKSTGFTFNLVIVHIVYGDTRAGRLTEISHMGEAYQYFEQLSGNTGSTIIAGDFNEESMKSFSSLNTAGTSDAEPVKNTTIGAKGAANDYDHCFVSSALKARVKTADVYYWTSDWNTRKTVSDHFPVFVILDCH